ncbi:MAG: hypothetical protein IPM57_06340 [Oligoflexia bacterium]|nr:hypothetical protein [Oligoflexia bacterium]
MSTKSKIFITLKKHPHFKQTDAICKTLNKAGFKAWLAGGAVRDLLINQKPKDFDIATDATPEEVEKLFKKTINVGKDFGAVKVVYKGITLDVVSFRKDGLYIDGRRPTSIERSSPEEDAKRRDFTINALFLDPSESKLYDFVGGQLDLKRKIITTVGNPLERFCEDKLRMLRAVRFVSQLGFRLHVDTLSAIKSMAGEINVVSGERIYEEINRLLIGNNFIKALEILNQTGLTKELFQIELFDLKNAKKLSKNLNIRWLFILSHLSQFQRDMLYKKLKVSHDFRDFIETTLSNIGRLKIFNKLTLADKKELSAEKFIKESIEFYLLANKLDKACINFILKNPKLPKPLIKSEHLIKRGIKPGAHFGKLLKDAFTAQLNEDFKTQKNAIIWLEKRIASVAK